MERYAAKIYSQNFNTAQNMLIYFRLHCYIIDREFDASQCNLLKKSLTQTISYYG